MPTPRVSNFELPDSAGDPTERAKQTARRLKVLRV